MKNYSISQAADRIYHITLAPPIDGFDNFITAWVYQDSQTLLVDPGPSVTSGALLSALADIGCRPDYILLTHIHIDHAGGIGQVSNAFPRVPVICHGKAIGHLADPAKLWQGTKQTLGAIAEAYGPIAPVPGGRLADAAGIATDLVRPLMTPGHAVHHISYLMADGTLFAGEAGGINIDFGGGLPYMRPATPPRFYLDVTAASVDRLIEAAPRRICYAHAGLRKDAIPLLQAHRDQLFLWRGIMKDEMTKGDTEDLVHRCAGRLISEDGLMTGLAHATPAVVRRERFFIENSVAGFIGYIHDSRATAR
ncbi:MAG: MBL fold metallo-hydrolase [Thermodesulfobacteriota bacterium]